MQLSRDQVNTIIKNAPPGSDKIKILDGLINRGYELEGVDTNAAKASIAARQPKPKQTFLQDTASDFKQIGTDILNSSQKRANRLGEIRDKVESGEKGNIAGVLEGAGQLAGAGADAIGAAFKGGVKLALPQKAEERVKEVVEKFGQKVVERPEVQSAMKWYENLPPEQKDALDAAGSFASLISEFVGVGAGTRAARATTEAVTTGVKNAAEGVVDTGMRVARQTKNVIGDVVPSVERTINHQVTRALDLTQGDVKNIASSTGNEVGEWLAKKNLIGQTKEKTENAVKDFYEQSYKAVRDEIGSVNKTYTEADIPRFKQTLDTIQKQVTDVPGLENTYREVSELLKKPELTLQDIQRAKELLDDTFSLYKVTGDVKEGAQKEGLAQIRKELKEFIEQEVKGATGSDIAALNNDVATARSIADAVVERSTRGLTRSNITMGDFGLFGFGSFAGTPLFGAALVLGKKIIESPTIRLRFARLMDRLSDAKKVRIIRELSEGKVPTEIKGIDKP